MIINLMALSALILGFGICAQADSVNDRQKLQQLAVQALEMNSENYFDQGIQNLANEKWKAGEAANPEEALHQLVAIVDGEQWSLESQYKFTLWESLVRNQGLACDGKNFWFSGTYSIERVKAKTDFSSLLKAFPLPAELVKLGDDHIGDIDYYNGTIYAPAEDGKNNYKNPYVVLYDAEKLTVKKYFRLPVVPQNEGVPWVAVDPANHRAFSALYYNVSKINVYDLDSFQPIGEIPLSSVIHNWQGAKMHNGFLYATEDAGWDGIGKHVLKINLQTGTVLNVATLPKEVTELEGLAFSKNGGVDELDALALSRHGKNKIDQTLSTRAYLEMYKKTQPSLRDELRKAMAERSGSF